MKARVALLIGSLSAGGIATSVMRLGSILKDDFEIHLVILSGRVSEVVVPPEVFTSVTILDPHGRFRPLHLLRFLRTLRRYSIAWSQSRWDCAIAFGEIPGLYGAYGKLRRHHRFVTSVRTDWISEAKYRARQSRVRLLAYYTLSRFVFSLADRIVGVTEAAAGRVMEAFELDADRVTFIYNVVDAEDIARAAGDSLTPDEAAALRPPSTTFVAMGRLDRQKGFDLLLEAIAQTRDAGRDVRLLILGKGVERASLERQARELGIDDWILFLGHVASPYRILSRADGFILSSRWEGISNALVEAILCRAPIIAADCPAGPREILTTDSGETLGTLVEPDSVSALSGAIAHFVASGPRRRPSDEWNRLIARSRLQQMTPHAVRSRWNSLLAEVIRSSR